MPAFNEKAKIRNHYYDVVSPYYRTLWSEHLHHGYWIDGDEAKEKAQLQRIELCLDIIKDKNVLGSGRQAWPRIRSLSQGIQSNERRGRIGEFHLEPHGGGKALTAQRPTANRIKPKHPESGTMCGR